MTEINWKDFESQYWSPEKGKGYELVLANWRQEWKTFEDEKSEKPVLTFDVLKIGDEEIKIGEKVFSTGAKSFAGSVKNIILKAEQRGNTAINVYLEYGSDNKYRVLNLLDVRSGVEKSVV